MSETIYPDRPGFKAKDTETSRVAADQMEKPAETIRRRCLEVLRIEPLTADQVADALQLSVLTVRPRISELNKQGKIGPTVERRRNASGKRAVVWTAIQPMTQGEML